MKLWANTHLQYLDSKEETKQEFVSLEQAPADIDVYRRREAVVEVLQPPFQIRRAGCQSNGLAEQSVEPW